MLEELKKLVKASNPDATDEQITAIATAIEKSGKFIPEQKYLDLKKDSEAKDTQISELQTTVDAFGDLKPEDATKASEDLKTLQQKIKDDADAAKTKAADEANIKHTQTVTELIEAQLTNAGAVDAKLVTAKAIAKAGGADKIELNDDGTLKTDLTFAVEYVKAEHPTNFTTIKKVGGGNGDGAGGGESNTWTSESVKTWNEGKTDQERLDNARSDKDYADAAGLTQYYTPDE